MPPKSNKAKAESETIPNLGEQYQRIAAELAMHSPALLNWLDSGIRLAQADSAVFVPFINDTSKTFPLLAGLLTELTRFGSAITSALSESIVSNAIGAAQEKRPKVEALKAETQNSNKSIKSKTAVMAPASASSSSSSSSASSASKRKRSEKSEAIVEKKPLSDTETMLPIPFPEDGWEPDQLATFLSMAVVTLNKYRRIEQDEETKEKPLKALGWRFKKVGNSYRYYPLPSLLKAHQITQTETQSGL